MANIASIAATIRTMFEVMDERLADVHFADRPRLEAYYPGLRSAQSETSGPDQPDQDTLEVAFYELLESCPQLRSVWIAAGYLDLLSSCTRDVSALKEAARRGALDTEGLKAKAASEAALAQVQSDLRTALNSCRSSVHGEPGNADRRDV